MKVGNKPKLDATDAERLKAMIASPAFQLFSKRVEAEFARAVGACERSDAPVEIHRAQGAIAAFRTVAGLPAQILAEIGRNG